MRDYDLSALRDSVNITLQKNVLFSGTVRDNLKWGNPQADDETIWQACRAACADEFLSRMPDGLDTMLEQGEIICLADRSSVFVLRVLSLEVQKF